MGGEERSVLPPVEEKPAYVREMFTAIAPRYDLMNRLMTLGRDGVWRRTVVRLCALPAGGKLLDVATGTGDIAYEALRLDPTLHAVGLDLTREMMLYGRGKHPGLAFPFAEGDALALPFATATFDAACSGFMMRNVVDIQRAFEEQVRVVRPGGRVVCLEITLPRTPLFASLFRLYFFRVVPAVGGVVTGQRQAYTYLPQSAVAFPRPAVLAGIMQSAGLRDVGYRTAMLGTVAVHWGTV
jgi:demethylmenaquinone methyltransferase/2-methoxy-6-polyprenyl-1,4-benzoquinol methylase